MHDRMRMNEGKKTKRTFFDMYLIKNYTCYNLDQASLDRYNGRFMCAVLGFCCYLFILFSRANLVAILMCARYVMVRVFYFDLIRWRLLINYIVFFNIRNWSNAIDQIETKDIILGHFLSRIIPSFHNAPFSRTH